jgi:hypothetical protein
VVPNRRQSDKSIRQLLKDIEALGWVVTLSPGASNVYKAKCPCGKHIEHVHSTPSTRNFAKNKLAQIKRSCP